MLHEPSLRYEKCHRSMYICCILFQTYFNFIGAYEVTFDVTSTCQMAGWFVAESYNCLYLGQVGGLSNSCYMDCNDSSTFNRLGTPRRLRRNNIQVNLIEKQKLLVRKKRGFEASFTDPEWKNMWYLNRNSLRPDLVDHNVSAVWKMGYTGRGVTVTFLDDGLEHTHPDLIANYDPDASFDINSNDADPTPRYDPSRQNKHGTRCAGEVAASANNSLCIVGVAYNAKVGGIRMLDGDISDRVEAASLSFRPDRIDIYSASWGPDDNGKVVDGPGRLAKKAFEEGATSGRNGKGSIFVWASGNGGREGDSCSCDGYINSIYTFAIGATTETGSKPWYQEECSGTLATTYSSGELLTGDKSIITTDIHHGCTRLHTGTSAAAPLATAFIALVLEARPDLTWRDVMYICVLGSRYDAILGGARFMTNAAGFRVSNSYGFGLMDAGLMIHFALNWVKVDPMISCKSETAYVNKQIPVNQTYISELRFDGSTCFPDSIGYIEQVQVIVKINSNIRGRIALYVKSPSQTESNILPHRSSDVSQDGFNSWPFLTLQFWGEQSIGTWQLRVVNVNNAYSHLVSWSIIVHGTHEDMSIIRYNKILPRSPSSAFKFKITQVLLLSSLVLIIVV